MDIATRRKFGIHATRSSIEQSQEEIDISWILYRCFGISVSTLIDIVAKMSHFYIILPSDSCTDIFPSNTVANFKTRLASPISLVGEWDVALYEIHYKRLWYTITGADAEIIYKINTSTPEDSSTHRASVFLFQGYYHTIDELVATLNVNFKLFKTATKLERVPTFGYNSRMTKIFIELQQANLSNSDLN